MNAPMDLRSYVSGSLFAAPNNYGNLIAAVDPNGGPYGFDDFALGYFDAARRIHNSLNTETAIDVLVYPIAFNCRQGIELAIKHLILYLSKVYSSGTKPDLNHGLINNWKILRPLLEKHNIDFPRETLSSNQLDGVEALLTDFHTFDPASFVFRYPEDKSGNVYISNTLHIDVSVLIDMLSRAMDWFQLIVEITLEDFEV
jgi:hypothetical protein